MNIRLKLIIALSVASVILLAIGWTLATKVEARTANLQTSPTQNL